VFPTSRELDCIYDEAYAAERVAHGATNQESGDYALEAYQRFVERTFLRPGVRVLDFGAATGSLVACLRGRAIAADGFEFSRAAREHCAKKRGFGLIGDLTEIAPASYDLITMIEVIEHLTDLRSTLEMLHATLKPGGTLLVTTPNRRGWRAMLEGGNWREARKKFHLFLFDKRSLHHHLRSAGFQRIKQIRFSPVPKPGLPIWMIGRGMQLLGVGGTLCFTATRARQTGP
jgi:cyclopropane fatty-acyl-phospholipid synthase-like methyltransferase